MVPRKIEKKTYIFFSDQLSNYAYSTHPYKTVNHSIKIKNPPKEKHVLLTNAATVTTNTAVEKLRCHQMCEPLDPGKNWNY